MTVSRKQRGRAAKLVAAAIALVLIGGICACVEPAPSGGPIADDNAVAFDNATEPVYLLASHSADHSAYTISGIEGSRYVHDAQGNLIEITYYRHSMSKCSFTYTQEGCLESITVHWAHLTSSGMGEDETILFTSTLDSQGRPSSTAVANRVSYSFKAEYSYYGESDHLSSVLYTVWLSEEYEYERVFNSLKNLAGIVSLSNQFPGLRQLRDTAWDQDSLPSNSYRVNFSEDGQLTNITSGDGCETYYTNERRTKTERANTTITLDTIDGPTTFGFDEHGDCYFCSYYSKSSRYRDTVDRYAYERCDDPSRIAYIFARLYE